MTELTSLERKGCIMAANKFRKLLALMLAVCMMAGMLPAVALAEEIGQPASPYLNMEDHYAYITGYSDGLIHPERNITRAQVAVIFYRLLNDETRDAYWTRANSYTDVHDGDWCATAISTLSNLGIMGGYSDGTFRPNANITRAAFITIAVRFLTNTWKYSGGDDAFTDIADNWARESINLASRLGIAGGYGDGTFRPNASITRAAAMAIVNNLLGRAPSVEGMEPVKAAMTTWPDNMDTAKWCYAAIQEATNSHTCTLTEDGVEQWQEILPDPDWAALEEAWAAAHAGETEDGETAGEITPPGMDTKPGDSAGTGYKNTFSDTRTGASVSFNSGDVAEMTVESTAVPALAGRAYVAYDITPYNADGSKYTGSAQVTIPLSDALKALPNSRLSGGVMEADGSITYISGTRAGDNYTFTTPHFSTVFVIDNGDGSKSITLCVGESVTLTDTTGNYTYSGEGNSVVTVEVSGETVEANTTVEAVTSIASNSSGKKYLIANANPDQTITDRLLTGDVDSVQLALSGSVSGDRTEWWSISSADGGYTVQYQNTGYYLTISSSGAGLSNTESPVLQLTYGKSTTNGSDTDIWGISDGTYYLNRGGGSGNVTSYNNFDNGSAWRIYELVTTEASESTTITFTGLSVGSTTVTVGGTTYNIKVIDPVDITLAAGESLTVVDTSGNKAASVDTSSLDTHIATVTVAGENADEDGNTVLVPSAVSGYATLVGSDISDDTSRSYVLGSYRMFYVLDEEGNYTYDDEGYVVVGYELAYYLKMEDDGSLTMTENPAEATEWRAFGVEGSESQYYLGEYVYDDNGVFLATYYLCNINGELQAMSYADYYDFTLSEGCDPDNSGIVWYYYYDEETSFSYGFYMFCPTAEGAYEDDDGTYYDDVYPYYDTGSSTWKVDRADGSTWVDPCIVTTASSGATAVSFTALNVGETSVTVGGITYRITVTPTYYVPVTVYKGSSKTYMDYSGEYGSEDDIEGMDADGTTLIATVSAEILTPDVTLSSSITDGSTFLISDGYGHFLNVLYNADGSVKGVGYGDDVDQATMWTAYQTEWGPDYFELVCQAKNGVNYCLLRHNTAESLRLQVWTEPGVYNDPCWRFYNGAWYTYEGEDFYILYFDTTNQIWSFVNSSETFVYNVARPCEKNVVTNDSSGYTVVTIKGVEVGTTSVIVGNVQYDIMVIDPTSLKYFPVTLFDYNKDTFNNAVHALEVADGVPTTWNGIYLGSNTSAAAYTSISLEDGGTYIIQNARAAANSVGSWLVGTTSGITSTTNQSDATEWTLSSNGDGTYTLNSANGYMTIGSGTSNTNTSATASSIEIVAYTGDTYTGCVQLKSGSYYLCQWNGTNVTAYGGYTVNNDSGNAFYLYKVTDSEPEQVTFTTTDSLAYAAYNIWTGNGSANGNRTYSGIAQSTLDANGNIQFNYPDAGLFTADAVPGKTIYNNVEIPFEYDAESKFYTFDANSFGAYFHVDATQGSTAAQSNGRLYYSTTVQSHNYSGQDGRTTGWFPFDDTTTVNTNTANYYFGMHASVPFSMTSDGYVDQGEPESEAIRFEFSGDDDVWVFIDGTLILDLGGIRNGMSGTINFATNTWEISAMNSAVGTAGDVNDAAMTGKIFNDDDDSGKIDMTRETFAAKATHELTIFYLERGAGSSNCQIMFNLPIYDTVSVTKEVVKPESMTEETWAGLQDMVSNLSFNFTIYKGIDFVASEEGGIDDTEVGVPLANATFNLLDANGAVLATQSTDANGRFLLKAGQTARFLGNIEDLTGTYYYVEEDNEVGFEKTEFSYTASLAKEPVVADEGAPKVEGRTASQLIYAVGTNRVEDSISFVCTNTLKDQTLSIEPYRDWIVVDYGLPVEITPTRDDLWVGDSIELLAVGKPVYDGTTVTGIENVSGITVDGEGNIGVDEDFTDQTGVAHQATYGTVKLTGELQTVTLDSGTQAKYPVVLYTPTSRLDSVDVMAYLVKVTATVLDAEGETEGEAEAEESTATKELTQYALGLIYIIPATSMYYEEDFGAGTDAPLVKYAAADGVEWQVVGTPDTDYQENGYVAATNTYPYGSDPAYLNDSGDSNGTSMYVDTTNGWAQFSYEFTGTGTSIFARTGSTAAFMQVVVKNKSTGATESNILRNNIYKSVDGTDVGALYNVPVYTIDGLNHDTYTVTVTLMPYKANLNHEKDFYLDGIRVVNPLFDPANMPEILTEEEGFAQTAYAADGEANMTIATLRQKLLGDSAVPVDVPVYVPAYVEYTADADGNYTSTVTVIQATDEDDNPISTTDGNPVTDSDVVQVIDEAGRILTGEDGTPLYRKAANESGEPILDAQDNPVYMQTDSEGNTVYYGQAYIDGKPVYVQKTVDGTVDGELVFKSELQWIDPDNGFVLFTDSNGTITTAEEYKSNGPKEEVYLNNGQSVTFSLTGTYGWDVNTNKVYLGIKAPTGSGTVKINGTTLEINNAADCYYDISGYATITTDAYGVQTATFKIEGASVLISVTNIKVTGNAQFIIVGSQANEDVSGDEGGDVDVAGDESGDEPGTYEAAAANVTYTVDPAKDEDGSGEGDGSEPGEGNPADSEEA
ncbi:MAG: S-layer homology domain-containing protein [Oscillospiraceae bacterium]